MDRTESLFVMLNREFVILNQRERKTVLCDRIRSEQQWSRHFKDLSVDQWPLLSCVSRLWNLFLQNLEFQWGEVLLISSTWGKVVKLYGMFSEPDQKYSGSMSVCPNQLLFHPKNNYFHLWSSRSKSVIKCVSLISAIFDSEHIILFHRQIQTFNGL